MLRKRMSVVYTACAYLLTGMVAAAAANPLSQLSGETVNRLEFGLFKIQYYLDQNLNGRRGERLDGTDLTFRGSLVRHDKKEGRLLIGGVFSSGWGDELTRGACTDALAAFQKRVISSASDASSGKDFVGAVFGSSAREDELYSQLLDSVSVVALLHEDNKNPVISCKSNLEGRKLEFREP